MQASTVSQTLKFAAKATDSWETSSRFVFLVLITGVNTSSPKEEDLPITTRLVNEFFSPVNSGCWSLLAMFWWFCWRSWVIWRFCWWFCRRFCCLVILLDIFFPMKFHSQWGELLGFWGRACPGWSSRSTGTKLHEIFDANERSM